MKGLDNHAHSVFLLYYHLILVVKYGKKVLDDSISNRAKEIFESIAPNCHITLGEWNHDGDHVHIMFRAHPKSELERVSAGPAETLEGDILESECLPVKCRRCTDRGYPPIY